MKINKKMSDSVLSLHFLRALVFSSLLVSHTTFAAFVFQEVPNTGFTYSGETWGASWGDYDGDGLPDIYVSNHRDISSVHRNNGDGTFTDVTASLGVLASWSQTVGNGDTMDTHGAAWGDFDNDGDQDLFKVSTWEDSQLLQNNAGTSLVDVSAAWGDVNLTNKGARHAAWFDANNDGKLDVFVPASARTATLFLQGDGTFINTLDTVQLCDEGHYAQLSDLNVDGRMEFICEEKGLFPGIIYDTSTSPFTNVSALVPQIDASQDSAIADFNGDLRPDIFAVTGYKRPSDAQMKGSRHIEAEIHGGGDKEKSFSFKTTGVLNMNLFWTRLENRPDRFQYVWIGAGDNHPSSMRLTLDPADPNVWGIHPYDPTVDRAIYVGYEPSTQVWQVIVSPGTKWNDTSFEIDSSADISDLTISGLKGVEKPTMPILYMNTPTGFVDQAASAGFDKLECISVVPGDFDNDMDVDLYLVCRQGTVNIANRLYENQGDGTFMLVSGAGGAEGITGFQFADGAGSGESVATADFDANGFLDLFITNGLNMTLDRVGGPYQLIRNNGNANHWIELDLQGVASNRDGVGAKVFATAGGKIQLREQNGGYHRWSQNHQRLHFGLAGNTSVTELRIEWPSGAVDTLTNVAADHVYRVTEGGAIEMLSIGGGSQPPSSCGQPVFDKGTESAMFIWQDCTTQNWSVRVTAGGQSLNYTGSLQSNLDFGSVAPFSIEANDVLDTLSSPQTIDFSLFVGGTGQDGLDFTIQPGANVCVTLNTPALPVYLGSERAVMTSSFNLTDFGPCSASLPSLSIDDVTVSEGDGQASFTVTLAPASTSTVTVDVATVNGSAVYPDDYAQVPATTLTFTPGQTSQTVSVLLYDDNLTEGTEDFSVNLTNPVNAPITKASGIGTILDNEASPCGEPVFDKASETAVFIWQDCVTQGWKVRMSAGTGQFTFGGSVVSNQNLVGVAAFSVEPQWGDVLDTTSNAARIDYTLTVGTPGLDGFDFTVASGASACFTLDTPPGIPVLLGASRIPMTASFDLVTLGACN